MSSNEIETILETATCELRLYADLPKNKREDDSKNYSIEYFRCFDCNGKNKDCLAYKPAYNNQNVI